MCVQYSEILFYEGEKMWMGNEPLASYFAYAGIKPVFYPRSTALYRGYIGTWEIVDQRLYLIQFEGSLMDGREVNVGTLFPDHPGRVFAHWYTGTISLPQGEILEQAGWVTTFEQDLLIHIEKGIVKNTEVRVNQTEAECWAEIKANRLPGVEYDDDIPF